MKAQIENYDNYGSLCSISGEVVTLKVNRPGLVHIKGCNYAVPRQFIGSCVDAVIGDNYIELSYESHLILISKRLDH
jgi:hypothetical protein